MTELALFLNTPYGVMIVAALLSLLIPGVRAAVMRFVARIQQRPGTPASSPPAVVAAAPLPTDWQSFGTWLLDQIGCQRKQHLEEQTKQILAGIPAGGSSDPLSVKTRPDGSAEIKGGGVSVITPPTKAAAAAGAVLLALFLFTSTAQAGHRSHNRRSPACCQYSYSVVITQSYGHSPYGSPAAITEPSIEAIAKPRCGNPRCACGPNCTCVDCVCDPPAKSSKVETLPPAQK